MYEKITLSSIKDGAVEERFQYELKKVLNNIADPNTETNIKRCRRGFGLISGNTKTI